MPPPPMTSNPSQEARSQAVRKLGVMAKVAAQGKVKTRLGATIGFDRAARIHQRFLDQLFHELRDWGNERHWVVTPLESVSHLPQPPPAKWQLIDQGTGDLGDRMRRWFANQLPDRPALPRTHAILMGADCPLLTSEEIDEADRLFRENELVLGPAADGGYYLIGLSGPLAQPILDSLWNDIPWSTGEVFERTVAAAESLGLRIGRLPVRSDIDTEEDLTALLHQIEHPTDNAGAPIAHTELARDLRRILSS
ncbi:TIGR04282 family arsenosugar biosynthesis glycosyltransferase [Rhodopirellula sp. P2]|uniref:TIGR04282 family arsenosugar biosynthesis glycosyltransferase n=1 Tax=Rhodopirellula sp. P2 TaxID=2127060 RepID=UPI002368884E|nr:TIGR04282 family arsenosugar biosynthesis glycosyltransferase [Rhodopirellula sp. P2]WDQ18066.1 TIGR04282 family arsenosugar biosynthesis glycosyltransferase [Rhodopirellula sp. P2]